MKKKPYLNALLSDICIGTSAAPTYLPPHHFETTDDNGEKHEFNLVDGGVAANNPVRYLITIYSIIHLFNYVIYLYIFINHALIN